MIHKSKASKINVLEVKILKLIINRFWIVYVLVFFVIHYFPLYMCYCFQIKKMLLSKSNNNSFYNTLSKKNMTS